MLPIAHRAPPSAAAAVRLVAAGARMIEVDVQLRGDVLVSSHYLPLHGRFAGWPVERDNWRLRRGPGHDTALRDVLTRIPADCDVLLDPKHHPSMSAEALCEALLAEVPHHGGVARFAVSTARPSLLAAYRAGGIRTWRSIGDPTGLAAALTTGRLPEEGVSVRHSLLNAETVDALHAITGIIAAWTVNSVGRARRLAELGVDAITTDSTSVLGVVRDRAR